MTSTKAISLVLSFLSKKQHITFLEYIDGYLDNLIYEWTQNCITPILLVIK